jgi:hypothetical protein
MQDLKREIIIEIQEAKRPKQQCTLNLTTMFLLIETHKFVANTLSYLKKNHKGV